MEAEIKQFSIYCDTEGKVTQIIQDESNYLPKNLIGNMIFSIVVPGDLDKILNFFIELKNKKTAIGWEINIKTKGGAETFSFFGGIFDDQIGIAAATTKNGAQILFTEITRINNEQANMIRSLTKENEILSSYREDAPVAYYEELSRLNNELVNMQRELSKKNRELDELNKLKNQFLGIAAHDLRNPLGIIMGYSEYLLEENKEDFPEDQIVILNSILKSSEFMLRLINDLLDVSAIESGNLTLNLIKADLVKVIQNSVELNNVISHKKNIQIIFNPMGQIPEISFDKEKIEQVLNNLISNAVKFSKPESEVIVEVVKDQDEVKVSVKDQGQGIPESELGKLFKPFVKTSVKSTAGEKSTGLGLSIVQKLILGHKGKIWVKSEVNAGTTFYFSLPL